MQYAGTKESMTDELTLNDSKNAIASLMKSMQHVSLSGMKRMYSLHSRNSLISEIRKNFLYKVGRSTLKLDEG